MVEEIEKQVSIKPSDKLLIKGKKNGGLEASEGVSEAACLGVGARFRL